ncbi:hypothetical protein D3C85_1206210 [compost metagenome]
MVRVPYTPLGKAMEPWLAGGMAFRASSAALKSVGGLVYAEGSVGGGGLTSSSGAALTGDRLKVINSTEPAPETLKKRNELNGDAMIFMRFPSRHSATAKPAIPGW